MYRAFAVRETLNTVYKVLSHNLSIIMLPYECNMYLRLQDVSLGKALCGKRIPDEFWLGITTLGYREWLMMLLARICASRIQGTKSTFHSTFLLSNLSFIIIWFTSSCLLYFLLSPFSYTFLSSLLPLSHFLFAFVLPLFLGVLVSGHSYAACAICLTYG